MAERLTEIGMFIDMPVYKIKNGKKSEAVDKLAQLEDIMEKYGIDVEELDKKLANFDNFMKGNKFETVEDLQNALNGKFIEVFDEKNKIWQDMVKNLTKTEQDRDTWKRACELACDVLRDINYYVKDRIDFENFFYQQAKKEVSFGKQLAIKELEKVKDWLNEPFDEDGCFKIGGDLIDFIDQQIKELKGE